MTEKKKTLAKEAALQGAKAAETRIAEEAKKKFTRIDAFEGIFQFLSLEIPCHVFFNGVMHYSAKHALLAAQFPDATDHLQAPGSSDLSVALKLVEGEAEVKDWSQVRLKAMEKIQRDKFQRSEEYKKKLKETGDRDLVWENDEDTFWGATKGRGQNHLGRILMDVRNSIQEETDFHSWLFLCCDLESESVKWPPVELSESKDDGSGETQVHRLNGPGGGRQRGAAAREPQARLPDDTRPVIFWGLEKDVTFVNGLTGQETVLRMHIPRPAFTVHVFSEFGPPVALALNASATVNDLKAIWSWMTWHEYTRNVFCQIGRRRIFKDELLLALLLSEKT
eukprot:symbB.v1.2.008019.t1/scaffold498.1/size458234/11